MFVIENIWNTVSFTKPTYITFPTFKPGSSADISFHFKTYRANCVFLESSDDHLRNFIRVELNSKSFSAALLHKDTSHLYNSFFSFYFCFLGTHNLLFIFMVGDGILNVTLKSPVPLNDNEWHFVQAEINVKLARIKVDWQPWTVRRFPGQTFVTMKFTQPLLVGKST